MKPWTALAGFVLLAGCGSTAGAQLETTSPSQTVVESTTVAPTTTTVAPPTTFAPVATTEAPKPQPVVEPEPTVEPEPVIEAPPSVPPVIGAHDRDLALNLPATTMTAVVMGQDVRIVAWYTEDGERLSSFVYERPNGTRAFVVRNDDPLPMIVNFAADPCTFDPFTIDWSPPAECPRPVIP